MDTVRADLSDPEAIAALGGGHDLVLGALPASLGYRTLRAVHRGRRALLDISFMPEDALELDALAARARRHRGGGLRRRARHEQPAGGHAAARSTTASDLEIYVGGLPAERRWPFDYKAAFAPHDVIEEYTRPARIVEHGRLVVKEALSEPELHGFPRHRHARGLQHRRPAQPASTP